MKKDSNISIQVKLDDTSVPERIFWKAESAGDKQQEAKAFLLSIFEKESQDTLKIDLWTKDMQVQEMDRFFFFTMRSLADTYFKATQNQQLSNAMQQFVHYFGEQTGLVKSEKK